jgi:hypothetical protein
MQLAIAVAIGFAVGIAAVLLVGTKVVQEVRRGRSELAAALGELRSKLQK